MSVLGAVYHWFAGLDARIWQAIVAGLFLAVGWIVAGLQNRKEATRLRAERLRDAHRAIFAEIDANLSNLLSEGTLRAEGEAVIVRILEDEDYVPLIPRQSHDRIFRSLEGEVHVLPRVTIDAIVHYYAQLSAISAHADDMRGETFRRLSARRRAEMYGDYMDMKIAALQLGRAANSLIAIFADQGKQAAEAQAGRINSSIADPSDP